MRTVALIHALEDLAALRLGTALGELTVITVAPPSDAAEALLSRARDDGAARTVRLWDESLAATDYLGVAYALAATVRTALKDVVAQPTVILCGDRGRGAVGPALAERLQVPHLSDVIGAQLVDGRVVARRRAGAVVRLYAARPPVVLCVSALAGALAKPEAAGWTAAAVSTEEWTLEKVGLTPAELSYRKRFRPHPAPGPTATPRVFADAPSLLERLRSDGLLSGSG